MRPQVFTAARRGRESGAELWMPHWSSCPSAGAHRVSPDQLGFEL